MLTSSPLLLPYLPYDLQEVDLGDERFLLRKEIRIRISSFVCFYELPPFIGYIIFIMIVPRILSYLHSWHYRWFRRGGQGYQGLFLFRRGVAPRSQGHREIFKLPRGVTSLLHMRETHPSQKGTICASTFAVTISRMCCVMSP